MTTFDEALKYLSVNDSKLAKVINLINPQKKIKKTDNFTALVKIIIGQQLSGSAARTIVSRLDKKLGKEEYHPINILEMTNDDLRSCGLSNAKASYIKGFAQIILENSCYFENLKAIGEKDILNELCKIKGIGIWTASIFAMSSLCYEDIFPYGDVSLNKAIKNLYKDELDQKAIVSNWSPYKSYACRVLWQWVDKGMPKI